jgi:hypothetical protein
MLEIEVKSTWNISNARELKSHSELKSHITTLPSFSFFFFFYFLDLEQFCFQ